MNKPTRPFEQIFIYMTGFNTVKDGAIMALFIMDGYSQFAFKPIIEKPPATDRGLQIIIEKLFVSILKEYKPGIHPDSVHFITNLPEDLEPIIKNTLPDKHTIVFDQKQTKKAMKPLLANLKFL